MTSGSTTKAAPKRDFSTGAGTRGPMRAHGKHQLVVLVVTDALEQEPAFLAHVQAVRDGADPLEIAKCYGNGARRRSDIGRLLELAAGDPSGYGPMNAAGVKFFTVSDDGAGREAPYAFSDDFRRVVWTGARAITRRGAGKCLECGVALSGAAMSHHGRRVRRNYCSAHEHLPEPTEAIRATFDYLSAALEVGAVLEAEHVQQPRHPDGPLPEPWPLARREAWLATRGTT